MQKSRKYPGASLAECIDFIEKIEKFNGPVGYKQMAELYSVTTSANSFKAKVSSSKQFGLIEADGQKIELTKIAKSYLYPVSVDSKAKILNEVVYNPQLYKELIDRFNGKQLLDTNVLANLLFNDYDIIKTSKDVAAKAFIDTIEFVGIVKNGILIYSLECKVVDMEDSSIQEDVKGETNSNIEIPSINDMPTTKKNLDNVLNLFIEQEYETESGRLAKITIPREATKDDLIALKDLFDILLKRKFKLKDSDFE